MNDYKVIQHLYNRLVSHDDDLRLIQHIVRDDRESTIRYASLYFVAEQTEIVYPAKAFAVAIIYAHLIERHFGTCFWQSLDDSELFCGTDRYFVRYSEAKDIYDAVIEKIAARRPGFTLDLCWSQVRETIRYFRAEFGLVDETAGPPDHKTFAMGCHGSTKL